MTPLDCKTRSAAMAAAGAVFEARLIAARALGDSGRQLDHQLYNLEHAYWRRADELSPKRKARK